MQLGEQASRPLASAFLISSDLLIAETSWSSVIAHDITECAPLPLVQVGIRRSLGQVDLASLWELRKRECGYRFSGDERRPLCSHRQSRRWGRWRSSVVATPVSHRLHDRHRCRPGTVRRPVAGSPAATPPAASDDGDRRPAARCRPPRTAPHDRPRRARQWGHHRSRRSPRRQRDKRISIGHGPVAAHHRSSRGGSGGGASRQKTLASRTW